MNIIISNLNGKPIYEQIASQIKALIISGQLHEGDMLPSMRLLAKELRVSVITTKRAYEELEREGFITSQTGKGSFVASKDTELVREAQLQKLEEQLTQVIEIARIGNVSLKDLQEMLALLYGGEEP